MFRETPNETQGWPDGYETHLKASPYLLKPLRSIPEAKASLELRARIEAGNERRSSSRRTLDAKAIIPNRKAPIDCILRDVSKTGARLELPNEQIVLPEMMKISVPELGIECECQQRWRFGAKVGVKFISPSDTSG